MPSDKPIILVDTSNAVYRAHFAHQHLMHEGHHTGSYHGFLQTILSLKQVSPRMVFCWDYGTPTDAPLTERPRCWRSSVFPEYKATRKATPDHVIVRSQMPNIYRLLTWLGYSSVGIPGLEADDVISCIAHKQAECFERVLIYSSDRDLYQILPFPSNTNPDGIQILQPGKKDGKYNRVTSADVEKQFGVRVDQWPAYLSLGGDSSDNIKPARGMGPKTAAALVKEYAQPDRPFKDQYITFRQDHNKLEPIWPRIQAAYRVAKLPQSWRDPNIAGFTDGMGPIYYTRQRWPSDLRQQEGSNKFMEFCAQHGLLQMLAKRREFFQKESET
jgi:DNA polymerase-1